MDYVHAQLRPLLRPGEQILHIGYLKTISGAGFLGAFRQKACWAALTGERLLLMRTRVGAFKPLLENHGVDSYELTEIEGVHRGRTLVIVLARGPVLEFSATAKLRTVPGQSAFLDALTAERPVTPDMQARFKRRERKQLLIGGAVVVAVVGYFAYHHAYGGRAEVSLSCQLEPSGVVCDVEHVAGGSDARACWDVVFTCKNGVRVVGSACTVVASGGSERVTLPESAFQNRDRCDEGETSAVENLVVTHD